MAKTSQQPTTAKKSVQQLNKKLITAAVITVVTVTVLILLLVRGVLEWRSFIFILIMILLLIWFICLGYTQSWSKWTGFGEYTSNPHDEHIEFQREKTFWDWMQLLIIPIMLAAVAFLFNYQQT